MTEITQGLTASEGKLKHLGLPVASGRSILAYANRRRIWQLYQTVFGQLYGRCRHLATQQRRPFRFKNQLASLDASAIDFCFSLYDWASYNRAKRAVNLYLLLDHEGCLPPLR